MEGSGEAPKRSILDKLLGRNKTEVPAAMPQPTETTPISSEPTKIPVVTPLPETPSAQVNPANPAVEQIIGGVTDPVTGETRRADSDWKGPGIIQQDSRLMGQSQPAAATEKGQPTYIVPGVDKWDSEKDSQPPTPEPTPAVPSVTPQAPEQPAKPLESVDLPKAA